MLHVSPHVGIARLDRNHTGRIWEAFQGEDFLAVIATSFSRSRCTLWLITDIGAQMW